MGYLVDIDEPKAILVPPEHCFCLDTVPAHRSLTLGPLADVVLRYGELRGKKAGYRTMRQSRYYWCNWQIVEENQHTSRVPFGVSAKPLLYMSSELMDPVLLLLLKKASTCAILTAEHPDQEATHLGTAVQLPRHSAISR